VAPDPLNNRLNVTRRQTTSLGVESPFQHPTKLFIFAQGTEVSQSREKLYWSQVMVPFLVSIEQQNTMAMMALNRLDGSTSTASFRQLLPIQPLHIPAFDQLS
jgi:hypothetical protein